MTREEKIKLVRRIMKGEQLNHFDLYTPTGGFIKCGDQYFNDGWLFTEQEFEAVKTMFKNVPPFLPGTWVFIDVDESLIDWLRKYSKPFAERVPGMQQQCETDFDNKMSELSDGNGVVYL